jgi:hypothetical protein
MKNPWYSRKALAVLALFVGIAACFASGAFANNTFTIAVIPDTQFYVDSGNTLTTSPAYTQPNADLTALYFNAETQWLASNKSALNLVFVTHVGDVVQNGDGTSDGSAPLTPIWGSTKEFDRAFAAMQILSNADIPFGMSPGNHDYDRYYWTNNLNRQPLLQSPLTNLWGQYFGSQSSLFKGKTWYGGASDNLGNYIQNYNPANPCPNTGMSSYQVFTAGGKKFLHISLELEAGPAAVAWVADVLKAHPKYATIITTHSNIGPFAAGDMEPPASVGGANNNYNAANYSVNYPANCGGYFVTSKGAPAGPAGTFQALMAADLNSQIFLVISGHSYNTTNSFNTTNPGSSQGEGIRIDYDRAGYPVWEVLTDLQDNIVNHDGSAITAQEISSKGVVSILPPPYPYAFDATGKNVLNTTYSGTQYIAASFVNNVSDPGGNGWIRLMTFDMTAGSIHFRTYSPLLNSGNGTYAGQCSGVPCTCSITNLCDNTFEQPAAFSDFYDIPMPVQVLNAASQFSFASSGFVYSRATKSYTGNLTITNTGAAYAGAIEVALNNLTAGVTLNNATGTYNGAPSLTASATGLAASASVTVPLTFSDPTNAVINFTPITY